jgi:poly(3-hydroxybutyrate) depolymerase
MRAHYLQPKVGHYGVFNGARFTNEIVPRMCDFIRMNDTVKQHRRSALAH